MRKMKVILAILGGIAAVVFMVFKGMGSSDTVVTTSGTSGGVRADSTGQSSYDHSSTASNTGSSTSTKAYTPPLVDEKWKSIPYEQVGGIKATHTEADIIKEVGAENVSREQLGREWGETVPGTLVYPSTPNQLFVEWRDGRAYEVIENIRIEGDTSNWQTTQGIRIGTTLAELQAINGKDFDFYGFEWDYAGKVDNWRNGNISEGIIVYLTPDNPAAVFPELLGDTLFPAAHHKAQQAQLRVSAIEIKMRRGIHF